MSRNWGGETHWAKYNQSCAWYETKSWLRYPSRSDVSGICALQGLLPTVCELQGVVSTMVEYTQVKTYSVLLARTQQWRPISVDPALEKKRYTTTMTNRHTQANRIDTVETLNPWITNIVVSPRRIWLLMPTKKHVIHHIHNSLAVCCLDDMIRCKIVCMCVHPMCAVITLMCTLRDFICQDKPQPWTTDEKSGSLWDCENRRYENTTHCQENPSGINMNNLRLLFV